MLKPYVVDLIVKLALREDVAGNDITSAAIIPKNLSIRADIEAKQDGVLCGIEIAERVFRQVDENLRFLPVAKDGEFLEKGREIAYIEGLASSILIAERTALNFLSHLSGIATLTHQFVEKVKGTRAKILDTRKTIPNMRMLEKYAVTVGGGTNHRFGLFDQALIKDNHLRILKNESVANIFEDVRRRVLKRIQVGIEVTNLKELAEVLKTKPSYILLDNMPVPMLREAILLREKSGSKVDFEVSGGITLDNVREIAETGVERISIGALTHSAPALDLSLDIVG